MARKNKSHVWPLALSPARAAEALCIREASVREAISLGLVEAYVYESRRVVVLTESLVKWVRTWKRADRLDSYQRIRDRTKQTEGIVP